MFIILMLSCCHDNEQSASICCWLSVRLCHVRGGSFLLTQKAMGKLFVRCEGDTAVVYPNHIPIWGEGRCARYKADVITSLFREERNEPCVRLSRIGNKRQLSSMRMRGNEVCEPHGGLYMRVAEMYYLCSGPKSYTWGHLSDTETLSTPAKVTIAGRRLRLLWRGANTGVDTPSLEEGNRRRLG